MYANGLIFTVIPGAYIYALTVSQVVALNIKGEFIVPISRILVLNLLDLSAKHFLNYRLCWGGEAEKCFWLSDIWSKVIKNYCEIIPGFLFYKEFEIHYKLDFSDSYPTSFTIKSYLGTFCLKLIAVLRVLFYLGDLQGTSIRSEFNFIHII